MLIMAILFFKVFQMLRSKRAIHKMNVFAQAYCCWQPFQFDTIPYHIRNQSHIPITSSLFLFYHSFPSHFLLFLSSSFSSPPLLLLSFLFSLPPILPIKNKQIQLISITEVQMKRYNSKHMQQIMNVIKKAYQHKCFACSYLAYVMGCFYCCVCRQCNCVIFPAPYHSYNRSSKYVYEFVNSSDFRVPYLFIPVEDARYNLIFFHGNAEDLGFTPNFLKPIAEQIKANIYAIEYPTYGPYQYVNAGISDRIKQDVLEFYAFLLNRSAHDALKVTRDNTIVMGRSIGSGPATYLACREQLNDLILISPFEDIQSVAADFLGCLGCLSCMLVKCHFDNAAELEKFHGKLLIVHGRKDEVIGVKHGESLSNKYMKKEGTKCQSKFPKSMTHNQFAYEQDILTPIVDFIRGK